MNTNNFDYHRDVDTFTHIISKRSSIAIIGTKFQIAKCFVFSSSQKLSS